MSQHASSSQVYSLACEPEEKRRQILEMLTDEQCAELLFDWQFLARPDQLPPAGDWRTWFIRTGRGWGKTRTAAEWVRDQVANHGRKRIALVAATAADARDVMVEGESGLLACYPDDERPLYEPSKRRITWPNGAIATTYSADEPERLRGPQHDAAWADEVAAWNRAREAWDMLMFGLRLGADPQIVVTTTPKPMALLREIEESADTATTTGSTYANAANLAPVFLSKILRRYKGTRLGRQEIDGERLDDIPGALWSRQMIEDARVSVLPPLKRVVVAVDPAVTSGEDSDDTGIIVGGLSYDGHVYVLEDATCHTSPDAWARAVVAAYARHRADRIVGEVNNGGELVETVLRTVDASIPYTAVHASRGKRVRAEPVAALYEQGRVHHVGEFAELEDQLVCWVPDAADSPDRLDALVWMVTELVVEVREEPRAVTRIQLVEPVRI